MNRYKFHTVADQSPLPCARGMTTALLAALALAAGIQVGLQAQAPTIAYQKALLMSWPETADAHIVVSQESVDAPRVPCLEPIFKRQGELCTAAPTCDPMRLFELTPGFQFSDDFTELNWEPYWFDEKDPAKFELLSVDGTLRIQGDASKPSGLGFLVLPNEPTSTHCHDVAMSVDILHWHTNATRQSIGFGFRVGQSSQIYLAEFITGDTEVGGRSSLSFWTMSSGTFGKKAFDLDASKPLRLVLTAVGPELKLALYYVDNLSAPIATAVANDSSFSEGTVGLWVWSGSEYSGYDVTVDNFVVTGTKP